MILRRISIVLMLASALALIMGSAGFSTIAADRGVNVNVASDDHAYVGYDTEPIKIETDVNGSAEEDKELVTVSNQLDAHDQLKVVDVEYDVTGHAVSIKDDSIDKPDPISVGGSGDIKGEIQCYDAGTATVSVAISVEATGASVDLSGDTETRKFEVDCVPEEISVTGLKYNGRGSFEIQSDRPGTVQATVWVWEKNGGEKGERKNVTGAFKTNDNINKEDIEEAKSGPWPFNGNSFSIVAIEFPSQENVDTTATAYIHPRWHEGEFGTGNSGGSSCPVNENIDGSYLESYESCNIDNNSKDTNDGR